MFWLLIFLITLSQSLLSAFVNGREVNWTVNLIWSGGWLLWILLTPLIFYLSALFPIERGQWVRGLSIHLLLGLGVGLLQVALEAAFSYLAYSLFAGGVRSPYWFMGLFTYKFHVYLFIYGLVCGIAQALQYFQKLQDSRVEAAGLALKASQLENKLKEAQIQSLRMQLQPHFLFNAHHAIIGLILNGDNEKAAQMLTRLSDLLRLTLDQAEPVLVSLRRETESLKLFLDIHQIRFSHRLRIRWQIAEECMAAMLPHFILQPLAENAIKHGISESSQAEVIEILAEKQGPFLQLCLKDDGKGLNNKEMQEGIGLTHTRDRLKQMYGAEFEFSYQSPEQGGFVVLLKIPWIDENTAGR